MDEDAVFWGEHAQDRKTRGVEYRSWREESLSSASFVYFWKIACSYCSCGEENEGD